MRFKEYGLLHELHSRRLYGADPLPHRDWQVIAGNAYCELQPSHPFGFLSNAAASESYLSPGAPKLHFNVGQRVNHD